MERFNRSYKALMYRMFSMQGKYVWHDKVNHLLDIYNSRKHRTIGMAPKDVTEKDEARLLNTVYNYPRETTKKPRFNVGDYVRLSKYKGVFEKKYTPNWGVEIFQIAKRNLIIPETYNLVDDRKEEITGKFYSHELQRVKHKDGYLIEKIIRKKGNKLYCKFLGFDTSFNGWVDSSTVD